MARIRTIKPELWQDEKLAPLPPIMRLVFLALISMADDDGRLVDNVKLIDGFMFSETDDSSREAIETLARLGRVLRYRSNSGQRLLQIVSWSRHQRVDNPAKYTLPAPTAEDYASQGFTPTVVQEPGEPSETLARPSRSDLRPVPTTNDQRPATVDLFDEIWSQYPKRAGGDSKHDALTQYNARLKAGSSHDAMLGGVLRYRTYCDATGKTGTEFVKQARTFLGRGMHFLETWEVPKVATPRTRSAKPNPGAQGYANAIAALEDVPA